MRLDGQCKRCGDPVSRRVDLCFRCVQKPPLMRFVKIDHDHAPVVEIDSTAARLMAAFAAELDRVIAHAVDSMHIEQWTERVHIEDRPAREGVLRESVVLVDGQPHAHVWVEEIGPRLTVRSGRIE